MSTRHGLARALAGALLAAALAGCGGHGSGYPARPAPETLPEGSPLLSETLGETDAWLRHYLMVGRPDSAALLLDRASRVRPKDELVRHLQLGVALHYAGKHAESNAAFDWAEQEAESRWTRSLSRQAGSLVLNDAVVAYVPPPAEMAMIPYYRMLNYLSLGTADETLVEARKATAYLARLRDGAKQPCVGEGLVQYLAGLVFRGAGERNDALVSYRQAEQSFDACAARDASTAPRALGADLRWAALEAGVREVANAAAERYRLPAGEVDPETGELVVLVEEGWVAHRAHQDIHVPIFPEQVDSLDEGDTGSVLATAAEVSARLVNNLLEQARWGSATDEHYTVTDALEGAYIMKLAWPVYRLEAAAPPAVRVVVDGARVETPVAGDLSAAMVRRAAAQRPGVFTRMVARGITKFVVSRELEKKAEKEGGEAAGWVVGALANVAGNALERADTRSWSLLPDRVSVARFTLPAGEHDVQIELLDESGEVAATVELGTVTLQPRGTLVLNRRVWGTEMGDPERLAAADAAGIADQEPVAAEPAEAVADAVVDADAEAAPAVARDFDERTAPDSGSVVRAGAAAPGAYRCALREATELGYTALTEEPEAGYFRAARRSGGALGGASTSTYLSVSVVEDSAAGEARMRVRGERFVRGSFASAGPGPQQPVPQGLPAPVPPAGSAQKPSLREMADVVQQRGGARRGRVDAGPAERHASRLLQACGVSGSGEAAAR